MTRFINHLDNHAELWGAVVLGAMAIASCFAVAGALNGIL